MTVACAQSDVDAARSDAGAGAFRLTRGAWESLRAAHEARVEPWIAPHLARVSQGRRHPVHDFLFEYYSQRPGQLRRWHPGLGVILEEADEFLARPHYVRVKNGVAISTCDLKPDRLRFVTWLRDLLSAIHERPPFFGCAGLHEWAMVYRCVEPRHAAWPMRFPPGELARIVESSPIRCSHHDAFRFFTPAARPLNKLQPARAGAVALEQSGCLHANMDLYKWCYKLAPFASSSLTTDAFELAHDIREVDMRASPYDLSALGFEPIAIETTAGRLEYEHHQRGFSARSQPIRVALIDLCERILHSCA